MILLCAFGVLTMWATTLFYIYKRILIGAVAALFWIITGAYCYSLHASTNDVYYLSGIFLILVGMFYAWEVWTDINVERKAEAEEARAEDLDDLQDRYEDAIANYDDKEAAKLKGQISKLQARNNPTINVVSRRDQVNEIKERQAIKKFNRTGKF
jgi:ABC-type nickel/cobalt efflux system permease component RcnA